MAIFNLANFQDKLRIESYSFDMTENLLSSRAGSGAILVSSLGPRLWQGSIAVSAYTHDGQREQETLIQRIITAGNFFEFCPPKCQFPLGDPNGAKLTTTPRIVSPQAGYQVTFDRLPANYEVKAGTYLSYYDSIRQVNKLHQIAETKTASSSGILTIGMVNPFLANSLPTANSNANFKRPTVTCRYLPSSNKSGLVNLSHTTGSSFNFIQAVQT